MKNKNIFYITFSGILIAIGLVLPFVTGQIPEIGAMLCPMHIPVLICGFVCGWKYGLIVGIITPTLRSLIFGMPYLYPAAISMSFELATYGAISGVLFKISKNMKVNLIVSVYIALILAMIGGRVIWGIVRFIMGVIDSSNVFSFKMFISGAFITAWPGIIIQLVLIPILIVSLSRTNILNDN